MRVLTTDVAASASYGKSELARDAIRYVRDIYVEEEKVGWQTLGRVCCAARTASARLVRDHWFWLLSPFSMAARVLKRIALVGVVVKLLVDLIFFESLSSVLAWTREASTSKMSSLEIILSVSVWTRIKFSKQDGK